MNADIPDRDQRLLVALASIEELGRRDQAIRDLATYLGEVIQAGRLPSQPIASQHLPLPTLATPVSGCALPESPPQTRQTLAEHPLASQFLSFLPYEYQGIAGNAMTAIGHSKRALFVCVAVAIVAGFYTGRLTIPDAIRNTLVTCPATVQSQLQSQPQ
jgi:hypothetical protein